MVFNTLQCAGCRFGDITAMTYSEQIFSVITMLVGMIMLLGVILGGWSSILTNYYTEKSAFAHRVDTINYCLVSSASL